MTAEEIRRAYLDFFEKRGHVAVKRAPLVLKGDPTTLFTGSGMQPMIPYLLGEQHPKGQRIVNSQTCLRAQDIEDIGDNRHTTFFEMLGNWSMGDYFKDQQIKWMYEFFSEVVGLDMSRLYITCYLGNKELGIPKDTEAASAWQELFAGAGLSSGEAEIGSEDDGYARGMKDGERIFYYDGSKNWWSRNGGEASTPIGDPCGPDSEMFYDFGTPHDPAFGEYCHPNCDCGRFMEIGNNVFMAYKKVSDGKFEELEQKNVDHGSGLERIAAARLYQDIGGDGDVFRISLMWPIIEKLEELSGKKYEDHLVAMRIIADHLRAATFLAVDGCVPSNKEQGYVMRRIIRRAIRQSFDLGVDQNFLAEIEPIVVGLYSKDFSEVADNRNKVVEVLVREEKAFRQTLKKGIREMERLSEDGLTGEELFMLYDTYGFPVELAVEEAKRQGITVPSDWRAQFDKYMSEQRQRSQTATKGAFKGGLGGSSPEHIKLHTANHLMYAALKKTVGSHVTQHGSNITEERLRFDFNNDGKVEREKLDAVEALVNEWIEADLPVSFAEYPTDEAFKMGAVGAFGDRYGEVVKVYQIGEGASRVSMEICGGPHVEHTGILAEGGKRFKITKEESSSAGIRRVKAVLR